MFFGEHIHVRSSGTESESNTERCSACRWTCHEITIVYYSAILGSAKGSRFFKGNFWDFFTVTGRWAQPTYGSSIPAAHRTSTCSGATHSSSRRHTTTHLKWWPQRSLTPAGWYWPRVLLWPRLGPHYGYMVTLRILLFGSAASVVKYNRFGDVLTSVPRVPTATQASKEQPPRHEHKIQGVFIYTLASKTSPSDCAYKETKTSHEPCLYNKHSRQYATTILETRRQMLLHCHTTCCAVRPRFLTPVKP